MDDLINELKHLGLSDKESSVYLAALELGPSPVQDISHKSKVNRATTYVMIESLSGRGLMSTFVKGKKRFYAAESPERLGAILDTQNRVIAEKRLELEKTLPMLMALFNAEGTKPQIRYLEGIEGIKTVRSMFEKLDGEFFEIFPFEDVQNTIEVMHNRDVHHAALRTSDTKHRVLAIVENESNPTLPHMGKGEIRIIPASEFPIHGSIVVRDNHIFLFSYKSAILSVVITSKEIADTVKALFELAWRGAENYKKQKFE